MSAPPSRNRRVIRDRVVASTTATLFALLAFCGAAQSVEIGQAAPSFSLATASGETISLPDLRGQVVYVDFWASWCGPCRRSFPWMNAVHQQYGAGGLKIVAINVDKQHADAERFLQANPARFAVVFDAAGTTPLAYAVKGMPSSYLIDPRGNVVDVEQGFRDDRKAEIEQRIRALLANR